MKYPVKWQNWGNVNDFTEFLSIMFYAVYCILLLYKVLSALRKSPLLRCMRQLHLLKIT